MNRSPIRFPRGSFNFIIIGIGRIRIVVSIRISKIPFANEKLLKLMQCPGSVGFQNFSAGIQVIALTRPTAKNHEKATPPTILTILRKSGVEKIRL